MGVFGPPESLDRAILDRCKNSTGRPILLPDHGFPISLFPDVEYQEGSKVLSPGDRLFLYTDGFTEASDSSGREYGAEGLFDAIAASRSLSIQSTLDNLPDTLKCRRRNHRFSDDLSMPGVEYTGDTQTAWERGGWNRESRSTQSGGDRRPGTMAEAMESFSLPRQSRQPLGRHWRAPNTGITILIFLSALNAA